MNFLPFIYQEKNNNDANKFIVYDICNNCLMECLSLNPPDIEKGYIYENENGYNKFLITRSSEVHQ